LNREIYLEIQTNQQGALQPDQYLIRKMVGVRTLTDQSDKTITGSVGSIATAEQVDKMLANSGYRIVISVPENYKLLKP